MIIIRAGDAEYEARQWNELRQLYCDFLLLYYKKQGLRRRILHFINLNKNYATPPQYFTYTNLLYIN